MGGEFEGRGAGTVLRGADLQVGWGPGWSQNAAKTRAGSRVCQSVASKWPRGAKVFQKVPKRCQKHVLEHPGGCLLGTLGSKRAPSQNIGIYCVKPTFAPPGELLPGALIAKMGTKVMQKVPGGRHRSARGGHLSAQGAKRCPKR